LPPNLSLQQPDVTRATRSSESAAAHMMQGSHVTYSSHLRASHVGVVLRLPCSGVLGQMCIQRDEEHARCNVIRPLPDGSVSALQRELQQRQRAHLSKAQRAASPPASSNRRSMATISACRVPCRRNSTAALGVAASSPCPPAGCQRHARATLPRLSSAPQLPVQQSCSCSCYTLLGTAS
jgi:hypothetical protein